MQLSRLLVPALVAGFALMLATFAYADSDSVQYELRVTNLTPGQTFTPLLLATHNRDTHLFVAGEMASTELELLAEGGDTMPLAEALKELGRAVGDIQMTDGLLGPGESVEVTIRASLAHRYLSLAGMLIPTNDTFVALDAVALPRWSGEITAAAWDAGSEANDQDCANIPGPVCGGEGHSPGPNEGDEGFVHIGNGFHELGGDAREILAPMTYDWRNPVAHISVRRVTSH